MSFSVWVFLVSTHHHHQHRRRNKCFVPTAAAPYLPLPSLTPCCLSVCQATPPFPFPWCRCFFLHSLVYFILLFSFSSLFWSVGCSCACLIVHGPLSSSLFSPRSKSYKKKTREQQQSRRKKHRQKMICPFVAIVIQGFTDNKASLYLVILLAG